jgi:hypothetical protein
MDTPAIEIISRINPLIADPVSKSVTYTFNTQDIYYDNNKNILYRFPYSKDTYWTHFTYTCLNMTTNTNEPLLFDLILITSDDYTYLIKDADEYTEKTWFDTQWPLPSINTSGSNAGIYFRIKPPSDTQSTYVFTFRIYGCKDLFPTTKYYILRSPFGTYQFVFSKFEKNDLSGSIWNVEHYDYIREIIAKSCEIKILNNY